MSKNTNTGHRIIAVILAIMMLLSVMPTTAFAAEGDVAQIGDTAYSDLKAALDDAVKTENEGCTVTLLADATLTSEYDVTAGKFTLDLNGKKIEYSGDVYSNPYMFFMTGGDVTIIDSVGGGIISGFVALLTVGGHLTLGKADGTANNFTIQGENCTLYCYAEYVTIYGGTYIAGSTASIWEDSQHYANEVLGEGLAFAKKDDPTSVVDGNVSTLTESVTVVSHTHSYVDGVCACGATDSGVAQIGNTKYTDFVTALDDACKEENSGCTVKLLNNTSLSDVYEIHSGSFTLDLNGKKLENSTGNLLKVSDGDVTIIDSVGGGKIVSGWIALIASYDGYLTLGKADGTANDFTVSGKGTALMSYGARATIYGGTYEAGSIGSLYIATGMGYVQPLIGDGYALAKKDDTTSIVNSNVEKLTEAVTVVKHTHSYVDGECACGATDSGVAQIGETKYSNFVTALNDAKKEENAGCTLTLLDDVKLSNYYDIESKLTLDLNGKMIERDDGTVFYIEAGGDLTVIDSVGGGSIVGKTAIDCSNGKLTLGKVDGTASDFTLNGETESLHVNTEADVTVYGGTFIAGSDASVEMLSGTVATILGEGLAFAKKDDTTSLVNSNVEKLTESVTVVSHTHSYVDGVCACGATDSGVAQIGETKYTDLVTALDDACKEENAGCTVKLLNNVTMGEYIIECTEFTLDLNGKKIEYSGDYIFLISSGDVTIIDSVGGGSLIARYRTLSAESSGHLTLGKADGTANNFTVQGSYRSLYGSPSSVTIYGGTYIAGSKASIYFPYGYISDSLGEGLAFAKKDDPTSVVDGNVSALTESVTVVSHTHSYVDGECACGATDPGVAQIGNTKYTDLVTALDDACKEENAGCTVKLMNNVSLSNAYEIHSGSFTLDLNGKKIEVKNNILFLMYGGDITIIDTVGGGSLISGDDTLYDLSAEGHITLGKADGTANNFTVQGSYRSLYGSPSSVTIYGGTYIAGSQASIKFYTGYISDSLGEGLAFAKKDDPTTVVDGNVSALTESVTVVAAPDSACVAQIGETKYTKLETALDEASKTENEGCTVKLLADATLISQYKVTAEKFTLDLNGKKIEVKDNNLFLMCGGDITIIDTVGGGSLISGSGYSTLLYQSGGHITLGKADGTANNFTVQGGYRSLYGSPSSVTIYGGTYIAGSQASIHFPYGYISEALGEGYILVKKDDPTSVVDGNVSTLTESVTVVNAEEFFAPKIISIDGDKPMSNGFSKITVTLDGHVNKLQVIYPNGSTSTFNNYSDFTTSDNQRGVVSITAYNKDGNEVKKDSPENVREIWVLNLNLANGDYQIKTKSGGKWRAATKFTVKHDLGAQVDSVKLNGTANGGYNKYSVKVNGSASKIQIIFPNSNTYTFNRTTTFVTDDNTRGVASIKAYDKNGNEVALGSSDTYYEIWVLNMSLKEGTYTARAKYQKIWEEKGKSFTVKFAAAALDEVKVVEVTSENGKYSFKLDGTAQKIQVIHSNGLTNTFTKSNSAVSVKYYDANDNEVEKNSADVAYEIWTISKNYSKGNYSAVAKYYNGKTYVWGENKLAFEVK